MSLNYGLSECFTISEVLLMGKRLIITHEGFVKRLVDLCVRSVYQECRDKKKINILMLEGKYNAKCAS